MRHTKARLDRRLFTSPSRPFRLPLRSIREKFPSVWFLQSVTSTPPDKRRENKGEKVGKKGSILVKRRAKSSDLSSSAASTDRRFRLFSEKKLGYDPNRKTCSSLILSSFYPRFVLRKSFLKPCLRGLLAAQRGQIRTRNSRSLFIPVIS